MTYGGFHRQMGQAWDQRQARQAALAQGLEPPQAPAFFPLASGVLTASSALLLLSVSVWHLFSRDPGKWVRAAVSVLLVAVMIQGLLGGYRVYLDQLLGQELSQVHGVFAQLVFTLMCTVPLLWRRPVAASGSFPFPTWLVVALPVSIVIQLIWGVMIRHHGGGLSQRLHMLTAFPVFALAILIGVLLYRIADRRLRPTALVIALKTLVLLQVVLGVEAYLGKFAALGAQATLLPAAREVTVHAATIRSLHVLVGTALLAISTLLAVIICRSRSVSTIHSDTIESDISRTYSPHIQEWEPANRT
jgi:heme A synthase